MGSDPGGIKILVVPSLGERHGNNCKAWEFIEKNQCTVVRTVGLIDKLIAKISLSCRLNFKSAHASAGRAFQQTLTSETETSINLKVFFLFLLLLLLNSQLPPSLDGEESGTLD